MTQNSYESDQLDASCIRDSDNSEEQSVKSSPTKCATPQPVYADSQNPLYFSTLSHSYSSLGFDLLQSNSSDESDVMFRYKLLPNQSERLFAQTPPHLGNRKNANCSASTAASSSNRKSADWLDLASYSSKTIVRWFSHQLDQYRREQLGIKGNFPLKKSHLNSRQKQKPIKISTKTYGVALNLKLQTILLILCYFHLLYLTLQSVYGDLLGHVMKNYAENNVKSNRLAEKQILFHSNLTTFENSVKDNVASKYHSFVEGEISVSQKIQNPMSKRKKWITNFQIFGSKFSMFSVFKDQIDDKNMDNLLQRINDIKITNRIDHELKYSHETASLQKHSLEFKKRIQHVAENVYVAIGYGLANIMIVKTKTGIVIIDTLENIENMRLAMSDWHKSQNATSDEKVHAVIYSHFHADHVFGSVGVSMNNDTQVWAHERTYEAINQVFNLLGQLTYERSMRQFGTLLADYDGFINAGIGHQLQYSSSKQGSITAVVPPTHIWSGQYKNFTIDGEDFELILAPGESHDQVIVYLPNRRILYGADNLYKAFPNLYAIRGTESRNTDSWTQSLDTMRQLRPKHLVLGHTSPISGEQEIYDTLTAYRDGIQYIHDQTIRYMNLGHSPEDIAEMVRLPPELESNPYLQQYYGTISWSVKAIFQHYVGWFSGLAEDLNSINKTKRSQLMANFAGGRLKLLEQAVILLEQDTELQWGLELATHASRLDSSCSIAKLIKIRFLKRLAAQQSSAAGRNWLLTSAKEVEDTMKGSQHNSVVKNNNQLKKKSLGYFEVKRPFPTEESDKSLKFHQGDTSMTGSFNDINDMLKVSRYQINQCIDHLKSATDSFRVLKARVLTDRAHNIDISALFIFQDTGDKVCMQLRHSVLHIAPMCDRFPDVTVLTTDRVWRQLLKHEINVFKAMILRKLRFKHNMISSSYMMYRLFSSLQL